MDDVNIMKRELSDLRRRIDDIETRLETRISAIEAKELLDFNIAQGQMTKLALDQAEDRRRLANLTSLHRAGQMAVLHLLGVVARAHHVSEGEIAEAMRMATVAETS